MNFIGLRDSACNDANARVERHAVALYACEFEAYPVPVGDALVLEDDGRSIEGFDNYIEIAVVEEIADGEAARGTRIRYRGTGHRARVTKGSILLVQMKEAGLFVSRPNCQRIDLRVDVP